MKQLTKSFLALTIVFGLLFLLISHLFFEKNNVFAVEGGNSVFAGIGFGNGYPAVDAIFRMNGPGLTWDSSDDNLMISDAYNNEVREVDSGTGLISGFYTASQQINGIDYDGAGFMYVATWVPPRVHKVDINTGIGTTVAGNGGYTPNGDGGLATAAAVTPRDVAVDSLGNVYIDQQGAGVRRVDVSTGIIDTVFAGTAQGVAVDSNDDLYYSSGNQIFKYVHATTTTTVYAGTGVAGFSGDGGLAISATFDNLWGLEFDSNDNLYIADLNNQRIRRIDNATANVSTVAGNGSFGKSGNGGSAISAPLSTPYDVTVDQNDDIYLMERDAHQVRKVDIGTGIITAYAGTSYGDAGPATSASFYRPADMVHDSAGDLYVADQFHHVVRKIDIDTGIVSTYAGNATSGYSGDGGLAVNASMINPTYLAFDSNDDLYIADNAGGAYNIRKVDSDTGIISTVAGNGTGGFCGDGGLAINACMYPGAIVVDSNDDLFMGGSNRIRKIDMDTGIIDTVAGNGVGTPSGDGGLAINASFYVQGVFMDSSDNFYIVDGNNSQIRKIDAITSIISTVVSTGFLPTAAEMDSFGNIYIANWTGALVKYEPGVGFSTIISGITQPHGVVIDLDGNVYISQLNHHYIHKYEPLLAPNVSLVQPDGGETLIPGSFYDVIWTATDASGVSSVDLEYTLDDLTYYPIPGATGISNSSPYSWLVPGDFSSTVKVRVSATDPLAQTGIDTSSSVLSIDQASCAQTPANLISLWKAEVNPNDFLGTNDGNLIGDTSFTTGRVGQAFSFDGTGDNVSIPTDESMYLTTEGSLSAWVNLGSVIPDVSDRFITHGEVNVFWIGTQSTTNNLTALLYDGALNFAESTIDPADMLNQWFHVAATFDSSDLKLYINGVEAATTNAGSPNYLGSDYRTIIGAFGVGSGGDLNGMVDEAMIFNRKLVLSEIQSIYSAGTAGTCALDTGGDKRSRDTIITTPSFNLDDQSGTEAKSHQSTVSSTESEEMHGSASVEETQAFQGSIVGTPSMNEIMDSFVQLFSWMDQTDYQLTSSTQEKFDRYHFLFRMKSFLKFMAVSLGLSDGYSFSYPTKEPIENYAELYKSLMIAFSDCFTRAQIERALSHDISGNGWWWAGYSYFLRGLIDGSFEVWDPIVDLNMIKFLRVFVSDFCPIDAEL